MSIRLNLLSGRTSGVSPVIFDILNVHIDFEVHGDDDNQADALWWTRADCSIYEGDDDHHYIMTMMIS